MICNPGTLRTRDPKGRPLCLAPGAIFPVIVRHHRPSGEIWSEIQILPNRRRVVVAENPERLARRIGKWIRLHLVADLGGKDAEASPEDGWPRRPMTTRQ